MGDCYMHIDVTSVHVCVLDHSLLILFTFPILLSKMNILQIFWKAMD